jgi:hypothetical protein
LNPTKFFSQKLARLKILSLSLLRASANFLKMKEAITEFSAIRPPADRHTPAGSHSILKGHPAKVTGSPAKVAGSPAKLAGLPAKVAGSPAKVAGHPAKVAGLHFVFAGKPVISHCFELTI